MDLKYGDLVRTWVLLSLFLICFLTQLFMLPPEASIFTAELLAIDKACEYIIKVLTCNGNFVI